LEEGDFVNQNESKDEILLNMENVTSGYDKRNVLNNVSFHVNKGEIVALIGPNGAGKSTALKTVFGFLRVHAGRVVFNNEDITHKKPYELAKRGMSFVHQGRQVFRNLSVEDNLRLGAFIDKSAEKNIEKIYFLFPTLKEKRNATAASLSGGQQQLLAIGRALMMQPQLLLLDEPSLGLDPKTVRIVFQKIKEIREKGVTILLVEQNARMALQIADRAYVFETGAIKLSDVGKKLLKNTTVQRLYLGG
jgi:branched-chain amino acid transport system ATP-binding protein